VALGDREGKLEALAAEIDRRIREAGFGPADKPWKSHLTIGRVNRERHLKVDPEWTRGLTWPEGDSTIGTVALMRSELRPQGPRYTPLLQAAAMN
jgi:2'-5' RNA ligase